jgi:hypothetical protein
MIVRLVTVIGQRIITNIFGVLKVARILLFSIASFLRDFGVTIDCWPALFGRTYAFIR